MRYAQPALSAARRRVTSTPRVSLMGKPFTKAAGEAFHKGGLHPWDMGVAAVDLAALAFGHYAREVSDCKHPSHHSNYDQDG